MLEENVAAVRGYWMAGSNTEDSVAMISEESPGSGLDHFQEIGHCLQSVAGGGVGTNILALCVIHFN